MLAVRGLISFVTLFGIAAAGPVGLGGGRLLFPRSVAFSNSSAASHSATQDIAPTLSASSSRQGVSNSKADASTILPMSPSVSSEVQGAITFKDTKGKPIATKTGSTRAVTSFVAATSEGKSSQKASEQSPVPSSSAGSDISGATSFQATTSALSTRTPDTPASSGVPGNSQSSQASSSASTSTSGFQSIIPSASSTPAIPSSRAATSTGLSQSLSLSASSTPLGSSSVAPELKSSTAVESSGSSVPSVKSSLAPEVNSTAVAKPSLPPASQSQSFSRAFSLTGSATENTPVPTSGGGSSSDVPGVFPPGASSFAPSAGRPSTALSAIQPTEGLQTTSRVSNTPSTSLSDPQGNPSLTASIQPSGRSSVSASGGPTTSSSAATLPAGQGSTALAGTSSAIKPSASSFASRPDPTSASTIPGTFTETLSSSSLSSSNLASSTQAASSSAPSSNPPASQTRPAATVIAGPLPGSPEQSSSAIPSFKMPLIVTITQSRAAPTNDATTTLRRTMTTLATIVVRPSSSRRGGRGSSKGTATGKADGPGMTIVPVAPPVTTPAQRANGGGEKTVTVTTTATETVTAGR